MRNNTVPADTISARVSGGTMDVAKKVTILLAYT